MEQLYQSAPATLVDQESVAFNHLLTCNSIVRNRDAALCWFEYGFDVIPIAPGKKVTAVLWDPWLKDLSRRKIVNHWRMHPNHEIGFIVGDEIIVFDADSPESMAALAELETSHGLSADLIVNTSKGVHHHFRRGEGTFAKSDSHGTESHPERIDVKTGRALVILPPSTGKSIARCQAASAKALAEVDQDFIDAVARHNGREAPRAPEILHLERLPTDPCAGRIAQLEALLSHIDPDSGYEDWLFVLMAIYHETGGGMAGLELANAWSSTGKKYKGMGDIKAKWKSFSLDHPRPMTIAFLRKMVAAGGHDWMAICAAAEAPFSQVDAEEAEA